LSIESFESLLDLLYTLISSDLIEALVLNKLIKYTV